MSWDSQGESSSLSKRRLDNLTSALLAIKETTLVKRKQGVAKLNSILEGDEECLRDIDRNSECAHNNNLITWNSLFSEVESFFDRETEKTREPGLDPKKIAAFNLIHKVMSRANLNLDRPLLSMKRAFEFIITKLESKLYVGCFGYNLIQMLQSFLSIKLYTSMLNGDGWSAIISVLINLYTGSSNHTVSSALLIENLNLAISLGSNHPSVIPLLRTQVINFYKNIELHAVQRHSVPLVQILKGLVVLCEQNAVEFRGILCDFGEHFIPKVLNNTSTSASEDEEAATIDLFLIQIKLHNPCDVPSTSPAFYSNDVTQWESIVRAIYSYCIETIEDLARKAMFNKSLLVSPKLLQLAARCTKQISYDETRAQELDGAEDLPPTKKHMAFRPFESIISDISQHPPSKSQITWIQYITSVLNVYPELVQSPTTVQSLFQVGLSLLSSTFVVHEEIYSFFRCLLFCEKHLLKSRILKERSNSWSHVWDITIKSLSVNQIRPEALELLRTLLIEVQPLNLNSLLLLFLNQSVTLNEDSVRLVAEYLSRCSLPQFVKLSSTAPGNSTPEVDAPDSGSGLETSAQEGRTCPRLALTKWFINSATAADQKIATQGQIALILVSLIVKRSHILVQAEHSTWLQGTSRISNIYDEMEEILVQSCFEPIPIRSSQKQEINTQAKLNLEDRGMFTILRNVGDNLLEILKQDYMKSIAPTDGRPVEFIKSFTQLQGRAARLLNIINVLEKYNLSNSDSLRFRTDLDKLFDDVFRRYVTTTLDFMRAPGRNVDQIFSVVQISCNMLSSGHLCEKMKNTLASKYPQQLQGLLKKLFRTSLPYYIERSQVDIGTADCIMSFHSDDHQRDLFTSFRAPLVGMEDGILTETRLLELTSLEALKCLTEYGLICDHKTDLFLELCRDLIAEAERKPEKTRTLQLLKQFHFDMCVEVLDKVFRILTPGDGLLNVVIQVLQMMCRGFHSNPECAKKLWELFKDLTPIIALETDEPMDNRRKFMVLVGTLNSYLKNAGIKTAREGFAMLSTLAKCDPYLTWSYYTRKAGDTDIWILLELQEFLTNPSNQFRNFAVETMSALFNKRQIANPGRISMTPVQLDESTEKLKKFHLKLYNTMLSVYDVPINLDPGGVKEEAVNRTALVLSCLTRTLFTFPLNEKKVLFWLLSIVRLKGIAVALAYRALLLAEPEASKTIICHLPYILKKWIKRDYPLEEFPYSLLGCLDIYEFVLKFKGAILGRYVTHSRIESLQGLALKFNLELVSLLKECFGAIMGGLAPGLAALSKNKAILPPKHMTLADQSYRRLVQLMGGKSQVEPLMLESLPEIILATLSLLSDARIPERLGCPWIRIPEPESPAYNEEGIQLSLNYIQGTNPQFREKTVIGYLIQTSHKSVYHILLSLIAQVHEANNELEKIRRLHHFSYYIKLIMDEDPNVFESARVYVSQFVVYAYLRLMRSESEIVVRAVIHFLTKFVERLMACEMHEELMVHYRLIVNRLIAVVQKYPNLCDVVALPLNFLMKTYGSMFADCIVALDPFPTNTPFFQEYEAIHSEKKYGRRKNEWDLTKELKNSLDEVGTANGVCSKERLQFIKELLSTKKAGFESVVKVLEGKKFSDECSSDIIHNLIQMLLRVITHSQDPDEVLEACRCLGEIGPVDLAALVLPPYGKKSKLTSMITSISSILETVSAYLWSDDIQVVILTSSVLDSLLQVTECVEFIQKDICTVNPRLESILTPFRTDKATVKSPVRISEPILQSKLTLNDTNEFIDYKSWIIQLTSGLISCIKPEKSVMFRLMPLCKIEVDFCEYILSLVFFAVLWGGRINPLVRKHVSNYFRTFFTNFTNQHQSSSQGSRSNSALTAENGDRQGSIYLNKMAIRSLIHVVQFLRGHLIPQEFKGNIPLTPWDNNFWIDICYLDLARAAQYCGAYLTSILYAEIYAFACQEEQAKQSAENDFQFYSQETTSYPRNRGQAAQIEKLLLRAYTSIGESDAVYSCGSARFSDFQSNIEHLQQMQEWNRSLTAFDFMTGGTRNGGRLNEFINNPHIGICRSLKELGLCNTLWTYMEGIQNDPNVSVPELSEVQYECGWRLEKWDLNCNKAAYLQDSVSLDPLLHGSATIQKFVYESIWFGLANDRVSHNESIRRGMNNIVKNLKHASLESSVNLYDFMSQFQMLRVVEDFFKECDSLSLPQLIHKWKLQDRFSCSDFKYQEPILQLRSVLLHSFGKQQAGQSQHFDFDGAYDDCLLELLTRARDSKRLEFAENCVSRLVSTMNESRKELEVAKNYWARGDQDIARLILGRVIKKKSPDGCDVYPSLLLLYGVWLSETKADRPNVILEKYLQRSCQLYEMRKQSISLQEVAKAHIVLAKYADQQYQTVTNYMKSELFIEKVNQYERAREQLQRNQGDTKSIDDRKSETMIRKQSSIDHEEIQALMAEKKKFLLLSLRHYLRGLASSNDHDLLIFRAFALWLENSDQKEELFSNASKIVAEEKLASYKYLVVLHQLSARMSTSSNATAGIINSILVKCAKEHPFHTLPVLLTQALLHTDPGPHTKAKSTEDRVTAAAKLVALMKNDKENNLGALIKKMELLWKSLIELANIKEGAGKAAENVRKPLPPKIALRNLKNLEDILVPTFPIHISQSGYRDIIGIKGFDMTYTLVGGINSPKRISCVGTNGIKYNMLLKGHDDLRQDAVMQQVFAVMNKLFQAEPRTKTRNLQVRTYKVVPLSQRSGIIEWCENTQTFGEYLVGSNEQGAHTLYRPQDYKPAECRKKMNEVRDCRDNLKKRSVFLNIMEHFKPVFRHFFFENFKDAGAFFERRLAYTRSVATSSMVGYILGLGDRHVLNILVDKRTAEFIHIDLGVAFEQGRILPTPETIPFRLTRDVVDGMGVAGVEGVFRRSCEMTLDVLRSNSEIILTILEVLLYDPLYIWTVTADRVQKVQPGGNSAAATRKSISLLTGDNGEEAPKERNNSAARVLLRLKQKLMGIEEGGSSGSSLSVPGHVALLIQCALDTDRQSKLFPGWQPYL